MLKNGCGSRLFGSFASAIWRSVLAQNQIVRDPLEVDEELRWAIQHRKRKGFWNTIYKLSFTATMYFIWKVRNMMDKASSNSSVCKDVLGDVRVKLSS